MKKLILSQATLFLVFCVTHIQAQYKGYYQTPSSNTYHHHFTRSSTGSAVYINQLSTGPILRLSSGTYDANRNVKFTVENNGSVGIGTNNPDAKLHIFGTGTSAGTVLASVMLGKNNGPEIQCIQESSDDDLAGLSFRVKNTGSNTANSIEAVRIKYDGKVGIGTSLPDAKLHVFGSNVGNSNTLASVMLGKSNGAEIRAIQMGSDDDIVDMAFRVRANGSNSANSEEALRIKFNGNVGIGTATPDYKLDVVGTIRAHEIKVNLNKTADHVFASDYPLRTLSETEAFINANKHLPEIASATEMVENGVNMAEFQIQLLQKIEELTLYVIELEKQNLQQENRINELENLK